MKTTLTTFALGLSGLALAACGSADEAAGGEGADGGEMATTMAASGDDCSAENVVTKISRSATLAGEVPETHPQYDEVRAAAGEMIDRFNELDTPDNGLSTEETFAQMCAAYDKFAGVARAADIIE
ncbi:hypothetical protein [Paraurantiacibacter namhicola]|uniref:Lipoprotein n=1 Tax=Paraurantiacibacter namhicola TaxID=645517 RepID=A0A1C7D6B6_9SPHN|nr:hypothetical protein [Paraurantiacibacter namhicola]ANU07000.1 hypothetical protein A6F65_00678 [Paraurantiacibacter namhicola]